MARAPEVFLHCTNSDTQKTQAAAKAEEFT